MKLFLNCLLLLLISNMVSNNNITNSTDCKKIKPTKPSDCVLSDADKKKNFKYCCYDVVFDEPYCDTFTQSGYEIMKDLANEEDMKIQCNTFSTSTSNSLYFKFTILLFILILF